MLDGWFLLSQIFHDNNPNYLTPTNYLFKEIYQVDKSLLLLGDSNNRSFIYFMLYWFITKQTKWYESKNTYFKTMYSKKNKDKTIQFVKYIFNAQNN